MTDCVAALERDERENAVAGKAKLLDKIRFVRTGKGSLLDIADSGSVFGLFKAYDHAKRIARVACATEDSVHRATAFAETKDARLRLPLAD